MKSDWWAVSTALTANGQTFELYKDKVWGRSCKVFRNTPGSLRELFASTRSDKTFIVYEQERYTFEETYEISCRIGQIIREKYGIKKGDRVAISMRNFPEWVFIFNAITSIGAIAVVMNALWQSDEMHLDSTTVEPHYYLPIRSESTGWSHFGQKSTSMS